jgi:hypothetical protein
VLRRISGPKRDEVTEVWRELHNEELHNLNLRKHEGKRPLGRPRSRWVDNIKIDP